MRGCGGLVLAAGFLASVLWGQTGAPTPVVAEQQVGKLELGVPVERELGPGLADVFTGGCTGGAVCACGGRTKRCGRGFDGGGPGWDRDCDSR